MERTLEGTEVVVLLGEAFRWTGERVAGVRPEHLSAPTPCTEWELRQLLDHTIAALEILTGVVAGGDGSGPAPASVARTPWPSDDPMAALEGLSARAMAGWGRPGALDRNYDIPLGSTPGPVVANISLLELVVHGWDISRATGEAAEIPPELAEPVLVFARGLFTGTAPRGRAFGPDLAVGNTPSERLVAFLGRRP